MILIYTLKWQVLKWLVIVGVPFLVFVPFLLLLALLPVPQAGWHNVYHEIVNGFAVPTALATLGVLGVYMMIYPLFTVFGAAVCGGALIEHRPGHSYIHILCTRLLLNIITFLMGIGVLRVAWELAHRFTDSEIGRLGNMLADYYFFGDILSMIFVFALALPLLLLLAIAMISDGLKVRSGMDIWDWIGFLMAVAFSWFALQDVHLAIQASIALPWATIVAIFVARYIDRCSEAIA